MKYPYYPDRPEEFRWADVDGGVKIVGYEGELSCLALPEELDGKPVVAIGTDDGQHARHDLNLLIPSSVRSIEPDCFHLSSNHGYFTPSGAWFSDFELAEDHPWLKVENNYLLSADGTVCFACLDYRSSVIRIPEGVRVIARKAISSLPQMAERIQLPKSLEIVEDNAFSGTSILHPVIFPVGTRKIGACVFDPLPGAWQSNLAVRAQLPDTLETLGGGRSLKPDGLEKNPHFKIQDNFILSADGKKLVLYTDVLDDADVEIPEGVEEICPYAFTKHEKIKRITLPESLRLIRRNAFCGNRVKTLRIPAGLEDIEEEGWDFSRLNSILVDKKNPYLYTDKTCLYKRLPEDKLELICCFRGKIEEYEVVAGTVCIRPDAFAHCSVLSSVTLPASMSRFMGLNNVPVHHLKSKKLLSVYKDFLTCADPGEEPCFLLEEGMVYQRTKEGLVLLTGHCSEAQLAPKEGTVAIAPEALSGVYTTLICPASLRRIEQSACAFSSRNLSQVRFNDGLEFIGGSAFRVTKLSDVSLPASLKYVAINAFDQTPVASYRIDPGNPFYSSENGALYNADKTVLYRVPPKGEYAEFAVPDTVTDIRRAFCDCEKITSIRLPDGIGVLAPHAVTGCQNLRHLSIGEGLKYASHSFVDFDYPITVHAASDDALQDMIEKVAARKEARLKFLIKGAEDLSKLSQAFALLRNPTGLTVTRYLKDGKDVVVPETLGKYKVTQIGSKAFASSDLESLKLPDTVTKIGDYAFALSRQLRSLELGSGVKTIGTGAFLQCDSLEALEIPNGVEEIPDAAFYSCNALSFLKVPASVRMISNKLFCDSQGSYQNEGLNRDCVYQVEPGSYAETFLSSYRTNRFFSSEAPPLKVVYQRPTEPTVSEEDQVYLPYLEHTLLEDGTLAVSFRKEQPKGLTDGIIPETLMGLPVSTLKGPIPENISVLRLSRSVTTLDNVSCFMNLGLEEYMKAVEVPQDHPCFWSDGSAIYSKDRRKLLRFMNRQADSYVIHPDCLEVEPEAFACLPRLKKLVLSEKLVSIGDNAFFRTNLESIEGIERIRGMEIHTIEHTDWFRNQKEVYLGSRLIKYSVCDQVSYTVREGTTEIARNAFKRDIIWGQRQQDDLREIIIPNSVTEIGPCAFGTRHNLKTVRLPSGLKKLEQNLFHDSVKLETLHIPASVEEIHNEAMPGPEAGWSTVTSAALKSITVEEGNAFFKSVEGVLYSADGGTLVSFPAGYPQDAYAVCEGVHTIAPNAFCHAGRLVSLTLPERLKTIGENAFKNCTALKHITIPSLVTMGKEAFFGCKALKELTLPEGLETIRDLALSLTGLTQITLPRSVKTVGAYALSHCPEVTIFDSIDPDVKPLSQRSSWHDPEASVKQMTSRTRNMSGWNNCRITVRSAQTGEIKFILPCYAQDNHYDYHIVLASWDGHAEFNFAQLDEFFPDIRGVPNKIAAAVYRLRWPVDLTDKAKDAYIAYLSKSAKDLVKDCIDTGDMETLIFCAPFGVLKKNNIDELIEYAAKRNSVEFSAYMMAYKNENFAPKSGSMKMPSLSLKAAPLWASPKTGTSKIGRYKGDSPIVEFPAEFKGKSITGIADTTSKVPENYRGIVEAVIPEGYVSIGNYAFCGCEKLEKLTLPSTLQTIGKDAFAGCVSLKELILPDSVTHVGQGAFRHCTALTNVVLSKSLMALTDNMFIGCKSLTQLHLPASVRVLCKDSLVDCPNLSNIFYDGTELLSDGAPFWRIPRIHVNPGTTVRVYGVYRKHIHYIGSAPSPDVQYSEVDAIEFKDRIFVLSGFGASEESRISKIITDKGGVVKSSLVVKTNYLILNEDYGGITAKYTKAKEMNANGKNIRILSAARFDELTKEP